MDDPHKKLSPEEWEDVLNILAAMLIADNRIMDVEVHTFWRELNRLSRTSGFAHGLAFADVRAWLAENAMRIRMAITGDARDVWVGRALAHLSTSPHAKDIYWALEEVALSDSEVHDREYDIIALASALLGQMPSRELLLRRDRRVA